MTSIIDRLFGRQPQPSRAHEGCCGGHGKHGQHAAPGGAQEAAGGCCGRHQHHDQAEEAAGEAHEAPVEPAGSHS